MMTLRVPRKAIRAALALLLTVAVVCLVVWAIGQAVCIFD